MSKKKSFFAKAFHDMAEDARAQLEVDKANFQAVKAESKADFEEAKTRSSSARWKEAVQAERDAAIAEAKTRKAAAEERIAAAKNERNK